MEQFGTYLTSDVHSHFLGFDVRFVHDLDGDLFTRLLMDAQLYSIRT